MTKVQQAARRLIDRHGSLRKAEAATGINYNYLHRLASGEKINPGPDTLALLGLERRETYVRKGNGNV